MSVRSEGQHQEREAGLLCSDGEGPGEGPSGPGKKTLFLPSYPS